MKTSVIVPPIKCQGIKTKLVGDIKAIIADTQFDRWVEPFCGSGVVAFNIQPKKALLCDSNIHIIKLYNDIKNHQITPNIVQQFLEENGKILSKEGQDGYYNIRRRFNQRPNSLDFLFLNRSCFNGVMRFNRKGEFNVPFCRKNERFSKSYITKIVNQVKTVQKIIDDSDWSFEVSNFDHTLSKLSNSELVYVDPPYMGRHVDYFNSWTEEDEKRLITMLKKVECKFILSTWQSNEYRTNHLIEKNWIYPHFKIHTKQHFYHVGSKETLRHPMIEALITNLVV